MSVSVEKTSNLGRRLTIQVPAEFLKNEEKNRLADVAKNMRIDGFRPGNVPKSLVEQKYGAQIRQEALSNVLQQSLQDVLKEQNMLPANRPTIENVEAKAGEDVKYIVTFEVFPEVELQDFANIQLEKEVATITDADIESGVEKLQEQFATWSDVTDRSAQNGDKVTIDFVGLLDGVPFENGSANDQDLELGSNTYIPGFEEGLVGVNIGVETLVPVTFPADYNAPNLAGKAAEFKITIKKIQAKNKAEVDETFAERIGIEDKDVSKVPARVRENMEKYLSDITTSKLREQVLEKLCEAYPLEIPSALLDEEVHNLIHAKDGDNNKHHDHDLSAHNHDDIPAEEMDKLKAQAKKNISLSLILQAIIAKYKIEATEESVLAKMASMALMFGGNAQLVRKMYMESKELRQSMQNMVIADAAADLVIAGATIKDKPSTFYGIVNPKS